MAAPITLSPITRRTAPTVRWLECYLQEREPTLAQVGPGRRRLSALADEDRAEAIRVLRSLAGSF